MLINMINNKGDFMAEYVNVEEGVARVAGKKEIFYKMLELFLVEPTFGELDNAIENGDIEAAAVAAHTIKGLTGNLSFTVLFHSVASLSDQLKIGKWPSTPELEGYRSVLEETRAEVKRLIENKEA